MTQRQIRETSTPRLAQSGFSRAIHRIRPLRTAAERLVLWKHGLEALRDWKIYADFSSPAYQQHNIARLQHLKSLGLDLTRKNVLELGAGIGDHTLFYLFHNCQVLAVEGRPQLAKRLSARLGVKVVVMDLDRQPENLEGLGRFDLVHCYGLLYHLSDPARLLSSASCVGDCLLLETGVSSSNGISENKCEEDTSIFSQALHGTGCRPTRQWVFEKLKSLYKYVYVTRTQPRHPEFPIEWDRIPSPDSLLKRCVFVASHTGICNPNLLTQLVSKQVRW